MNTNLLVLGGAGFVGSSLSIACKKLNPHWRIVCFDNLRRRGSEINLTRLRDHDVNFVHGDIRNPEDLDIQAVGEPATIIDCSAEPSILAGVTSPEYVLNTNLMGTINILELTRRVGARLIFLSSSRVYSVPALRAVHLVEKPTRLCLSSEQTQPGISHLGISEDFSTRGFRSLYGSTKLASEMLIQEYREAFGLKAIVNRCGVLTGPWQMGKVDQGVFVLWLAAHYFKFKLSYVGFGGTGKQIRDLLHIDDLANLIYIELNRFEELEGETFNVGGGMACSLSLLETTALCREITGRAIEITQTPHERPADVPFFVADNTKVTSRTAWRPARTPQSTLQEIHSWITQNEAVLRPVLT